MGADMIINYVAVPKGWNEEKAQKNMLEAIKNLTKEDFINNPNFNFVDLIERYVIKYDLEGLEEKDIQYEDDPNHKMLEVIESEEGTPSFKQFLKNLIIEFFGCLNSREVAAIEHKGEILYLTGGMSWGEDPTESGNIFYLINELPQCILNEGEIK